MAGSANLFELQAGTRDFNDAIVPQNYVALGDNINRIAICKKRAVPRSGLHVAITKILQRQLWRRRRRGRRWRGIVAIPRRGSVNRRGRGRGETPKKKCAGGGERFRRTNVR